MSDITLTHIEPEPMPRAQNIKQATDFLGVPVHLYTMAESLALIRSAMKHKTRLIRGDVNVALFIAMKQDPDFFEALTMSDLINVDGMGILLGCRLMGLPINERVSGIDMMMKVLELSEQQHFRPYFFGAKQEIVSAMVSKLEGQFPALKIAGFRNGYFSADDEEHIVNEINRSGADCLFIGISSPIKENFIRKHQHALNVPYIMGVGGSFDVIGGKVKRAPLWMQRNGLEWVYRLIQEPRRMWKRYLVTNSLFALYLLRGMVSHYILKRGSKAR